MNELEDVIEGCRRGDAAMQKELYDRYSPRFFALCCRYAPDDFIAKEMLIDGFMTIFSSIDKYRGDGAFEAWMRVIMLRRVVANYRRNRKYRETLPIEESVEVSLPTGHPEHNIDVRDALREALRLLNEKERTAFNLVAVEKYTFNDAADFAVVAADDFDDVENLFNQSFDSIHDMCLRQ